MIGTVIEAADIGRALRDNSDEVHAIACALVADLAAATADDTVRGRLAVRAVVHHNGFVKLVVVDTDEWDALPLQGFRLVLHVWDPAVAPHSVEEIHNHRWRFASVLLCGALKWEHFHEYDGEDEPIPCLEYEYRSPGRGTGYRLRPRGPVTLARQFVAMAGVGARSMMTVSQIHRVEPVADTLSATLFLQFPVERTWTRVFVESWRPASTATRSLRRPEPVELAGCLSRLALSVAR
jgi:hypothetical protein